MRLERWAEQMQRIASSFPEISAVYHGLDGDVLEFYVVARFSDRERENEFYRREAELYGEGPAGGVSVSLLNLEHYEEADVDSAPPKNYRPLQIYFGVCP